MNYPSDKNWNELFDSQETCERRKMENAISLLLRLPSVSYLVTPTSSRDQDYPALLNNHHWPSIMPITTPKYKKREREGTNKMESLKKVRNTFLMCLNDKDDFRILIACCLTYTIIYQKKLPGFIREEGTPIHFFLPKTKSNVHTSTLVLSGLWIGRMESRVRVTYTQRARETVSALSHIQSPAHLPLAYCQHPALEAPLAEPGCKGKEEQRA